MMYLHSAVNVQSTLNPSFNCLYLLENTNFYILEIKRTDLPIDADLGVRYQWLKIYKVGYTVQPFTFRAIDSSDQIEERFFDEGYLKFNYATGTFIEKYNSAQHQLIQRNSFELPKKLVQAIDLFILKTENC